MTLHATGRPEAPSWNAPWWDGATGAVAHEPLRARATLADTTGDVEMLPRHGIVAPAVSLDHGPLRRGRPAPRRRVPVFALVAVAAMTGVVWLGVWLLGPLAAWLIAL